MAKKYDIDLKKLWELYYIEKKSVKDVSDYFNVSTSVIRKRMDENGWERRSSGPIEGTSWEEMFDDETLEKQKEHIKNLKYWENKDREKFSKKYSGDDHWHKGRNISEEWSDKISKGVEKSYDEIDNLREQRRKQFQKNCGPAYNPKACEIIEKYGEEQSYDFQHAENGGEKSISGYFVDGYDEKQNTVVEYYEKWHQNRREKDKKRKQEIIESTDCRFIEIYEEGFIKIN